MANLNITTVVRPKIPRNKYGYLNSGVIIGGSTYNSGGSGGGSGGGGDSSGGETYSDFTGATAVSNGSHGLVPAPSRGQQNYVLHGCGNWRELFGGHLQYDEETGTLMIDSSLSGTKAYFEHINVDDISVNNTLDSYIVNSSTGNIKVINSSTGNIHDLNSSIGNFRVVNSSQGFIKELHSEDIYTKNLTVTGLAHFFELVIDRIKAAGGAVLFTPADGFQIEQFEQSTNGYKLYWSSTDGEKGIKNMWKVNDQAICMSFNRADIGHNYNISNKYYWCLVTGVGTDQVNGLHWIEISTSVYDGEVNPEVGDEIVMLGYRGTDDSARQNAIYISAYSSLDTTLTAPLWAHYTGINDFNLSSHKRTWFASNGSNIRGSLQIETGQNIEDLLDDIPKANIDIRVFSSIGTVMNQGERQAILTAQVWYSNVDITSQIPYELFDWERESNDSNDDQLFNNTHKSAGSTITITDMDILNKASFFCCIDTDELKRRNIIQ